MNYQNILKKFTVKNMHDFENNNIVHAASVWILYEDVLTAKKNWFITKSNEIFMLVMLSCWCTNKRNSYEDYGKKDVKKIDLLVNTSIIWRRLCKISDQKILHQSCIIYRSHHRRRSVKRVANKVEITSFFILNIPKNSCRWVR